MATEKPKISFIIGVVIIFLIAWCIQQQLFLNVDASALLLETQRLLQGGNYFDNFFTPNPPMAMYIHIPPVLLAEFTHISIVTAFLFYVFSLTLLSLVFSYQLVTKIFQKKDILQGYIFLSAIAVVFLIIPMLEFGERDHLMTIMTMPYLLLTVCRLENKPINPRSAVAIGLFAGIGAAIKPQFVILPILIEAYYLYNQKNWLAWIKPETLTILSVLITYAIIVLATRQDYIFIMIPYLIKNYYSTASKASLYNFLFYNAQIFTYVSLPFYILLYEINQYKKLSTVLFIAVISFIITYITQHYTYLYHMTPAFSVAILMLTQFYINISTQKKLTHHDYAMIAIAFVGPLILLLIISMQFFLILGGLLILFILAFAKSKKIVFYRLATILLGILLLIAPSTIILSSYQNSLHYKTAFLNKLIAFIHTQPPHRTFLVISGKLAMSFPLANYTDATLVQRYDGLWMSPIFRPGYINQASAQYKQALKNNFKNNHNKTFIVNIISDDLRIYKPDFIFVDTSFDFNFLDYFLENAEFSQIWQNYHYLTTIKEAGYYKLDIYTRNR